MQNNEILIIHGRHKGAIFHSVKNLSKLFWENGIKNSLYCMNNNSFTFISIIKSLFYLNGKDKNTLLILMHFDPMALGLLLKLINFNRIINVVHTDIISYYLLLNPIKKIIFALFIFFKKKERFIFISRESQQKAKTFFSLKNTDVIHNIKECKTKSLFNIKSDSQIVLGSVSRLDKLKNIDLIIRLINKLVIIGYDIKLLIFGDGPELLRLKNYTKILSIDNNVIFMGEVSNKNLIYNSIDALISLSVIEGMPSTIFESIEHSKPVFFTDCSSGPREIMSPLSDPIKKTSSFEITSVGYLVYPLNQLKNSYSMHLSSDEIKYIDLLEQFITDVKSNNFSMNFDWNSFSSASILERWKKVIFAN
jgi:glycosyltransferase involved in cell wall biosynthesis